MIKSLKKIYMLPFTEMFWVCAVLVSLVHFTMPHVALAAVSLGKSLRPLTQVENLLMATVFISYLIYKYRKA